MSGSERRVRFALAVVFALSASPVAAQGADPAALLDALRASHDPVRQIQLIDDVGRIAAPASTALDAAKAALQSGAPPLLLGLVRDTGTDWSVRGEAMTCLRTIDAPDDIVSQAVAAAKADEGDHAGYLRAQGVTLQTWRDTRANARGVPAATDADAERRARVLLRGRGIEVSFDALADAVGDGQAGTVASLMTAGLKVSGADAAWAKQAVVNGLTTACSRDPVPSLGAAQAISFLVGHGFPLDLPDESGNTLLMSAAQFCPAPIAARLLALGARLGAVNKQRFTPLQMALVSGKWDVAEVLVNAGARITHAEADQIFFQPPEAQSQRDLLSRATQ